MNSLIAGTDLQSLIDVGFVVVVVLACLPGLLNNGAKSDKRSAKWKEELLGLEQMLRELIKEAGAAGSNLDRSLFARQRELEDLVSKLERLKAGNNEAFTMGSASQIVPLRAEDELPNASWARPATKPAEADEREVVSHRTKKAVAQDFSLAELAVSKNDKISLSTSATDRVQKLKQISTEVLSEHARRREETLLRPTYTPQSIASQIEIEEEPAPSGMLAHLDPVTYKVARRLLINGQELHVVARKLEIPLAEVRILDKLIRQSQEAVGAQSFAASRANGAGFGIKREVALL